LGRDRAFGSTVIRHRDQSGLATAGGTVMARLGSDVGARRPCRGAWTETIRAISPNARTEKAQ
jgi:hypothetical protein